MSVFKDKTLLITGGTGSFGNAVLRRFLDSDIKEIRIFLEMLFSINWQLGSFFISSQAII